MIKECRVLSYNKILNIIVIDFDGVVIQMSGTIDEKDKTIYVRYEDGMAYIASKEEYETSLKPKAEKKVKKVKTIDEIVESEAVENETDEVSE